MSINAACELLGYSRSTFFEIRKNRKSKFERELSSEKFILKKVKEIRKDLGKCGGKKLYYLICKDPEKEHYKFGRKKLFEVLRSLSCPKKTLLHGVNRDAQNIHAMKRA